MPPITPPAARRLRLTAAALTVGSVLFAAGCGTPPWKEGAAGAGASPAAGSATPVSSASPTASPTPSQTPSPSATRSVTNDLATGSAHHTVDDGAAQLKIDYWSTLAMDQWKPGVIKPLSMSLTAKLADAPKEQKVYLSKATLVVTPQGPNGALQAVAPISDKSDSKPGYVIRSPYSYTQVFQLPALPTEATSVDINIVYDVLVQSQPKSKEYARQSASDQLTIALA